MPPHHTLSLTNSPDGLQVVAAHSSLALSGHCHSADHLTDCVGSRRRFGLVVIVLYTQAVVFATPTLMEGWSLRTSEAEKRGAALVATNVGRRREFAVDGGTALLARAKDLAGLVERIVRLIDDQDSRVRWVRAGHVRRFAWEAGTEGCLRHYVATAHDPGWSGW